MVPSASFRIKITITIKKDLSRGRGVNCPVLVFLASRQDS